jgi:hypothetical protein
MASSIQVELSNDRLEKIEELLCTLLDVRARDTSSELIDLERQVLKMRSRAAD